MHMKIKNAAVIAKPSALSQVGGFLGERFLLNKENKLKNQSLSEKFIQLVERKSYSDWFWLGEQLGKWFYASIYSALISGDEELKLRVESYINRAAAAQESNGRFSIGSPDKIKPVRGMELYENYFVMHGLLAVYMVLGEETALEIAKKMADYYTGLYGTGPGQYPMTCEAPGTGHQCHYGTEGTLFIHPVALLYELTGEKKYLEWCEMVVSHWDEWASYPPAKPKLKNMGTKYLSNLKEVVKGTKELYEFHPVYVHAHTLNMNLLGLAELYRATGRKEYFEIVEAVVDNIVEKHLTITGGLSNEEKYQDPSYYSAVSGVEVCPQASWIWLNWLMYEITGEAKYYDYIERTVFNHFLAAQTGDGSNWSYFTPYNGQAAKPEGPNCCNGIGSMFLSLLPSMAYGIRESGFDILLFLSSTFTGQLPSGNDFSIRQTTEFPEKGRIKLEVLLDGPEDFTLRIRKPGWSKQVTLFLNQQAIPVSYEKGFIILHRTWDNEDVVELDFDLSVSVLTEGNNACLTRGPIVYAVFENLQNEDCQEVLCRGETIELAAEETAPVVQMDTRNGLLGPAYKVRGVIKSEAVPLFFNSQNNSTLSQQIEEEFILLPFCNQGAVKGRYWIFFNAK